MLHFDYTDWLVYPNKGKYYIGGNIKLKKLLNISSVGFLIGGLLVGCGTEAAKEVETKIEPAKEVKVDSAKVDPKEWKDLSSAGDLTKADFSTNAKDWIESTLYQLNLETPDKYIEAGFDEEYDQYMKAMSLTNVLGTYIKVEGIDLNKDFENIHSLATIIQAEHEKRTEHLELEYVQEKYGANKQAANQEWKPATQRQQQAFEYLKQLVNDVNIAINETATGEAFGVSNQLDGEKVEVLKSFINE
jgi:hypothetical protein